MMALVLFSMAALVVDLGCGPAERRAAQNTADASALAAGNVLYSDHHERDGPPPPATRPPRQPPRPTPRRTAGSPHPTGPPAPIPASSRPSGTECISFQVTAGLARIRVRVPGARPRDDLRQGDRGRLDRRRLPWRAPRSSSAARATAACASWAANTLHDVQNGDVTVQGAGIHFNGNVSVSSNGLIATGARRPDHGGGHGQRAPEPTTSPTRRSASPRSPTRWPTSSPSRTMTSLTCRGRPVQPQGPGIYGDKNFSGPAPCRRAPTSSWASWNLLRQQRLARGHRRHAVLHLRHHDRPSRPAPPRAKRAAKLDFSRQRHHDDHAPRPATPPGHGDLVPPPQHQRARA